MFSKIRILRVFATLSAAMAAGCASIPPDRDFQSVRQLEADRGHVMPDDAGVDRAKTVSEILARPLSEADAVRVAFLQSPRIQTEYARLGLTGADVIQAGRLSNPTLSASVLGSSVPGDLARYDLGLSQNFADLLLLRARIRFSRGDFERAKLDVAQALLDLATQVQSAYYGAVGAQQVALMRKTITADASAAADLSVRFKDAGNQTALQLARYRGAESQAKLDEERAEADAARAASLLNELMGLDADAHWKLLGALPSPAAHEETLDELQQLASNERLDLQSARRGVRLLEDSFDLTRRYRFLGVVDVGAQYERDTDRNRLLGPSLSLQLPLFSQGQAPLLRAQSRLELVRAELAAKELEVSNGVRRSHERVTAARKRVDRLREESIPLREAVVAHTQEQVNYMLVGVFELLRVKQEEYDTYQQYLEAVRDYWQARVELARAAGTRLPSDASIGEATVMPRVPVEPPENSGHMHHGSNTATPSGPAQPAVPTPSSHHHEASPPAAAPAGTLPADGATPEAPPHGDYP